MQVSLSVESDLPCLDFSVLLIDFVSNQNNGDVVANSGQVFIPFGNVFVCDSGGDVEHEDGSIGTNVVSFSETAKLFLSGGIPKGELDRAVIGVESDRADFNTLSGDIFFFELTSDVSFDECGFSNSTVSDQDDFEFGNDLRALHVQFFNYYYLVANNTD